MLEIRLDEGVQNLFLCAFVSRQATNAQFMARQFANSIRIVAIAAIEIPHITMEPICNALHIQAGYLTSIRSENLISRIHAMTKPVHIIKREKLICDRFHEVFLLNVMVTKAYLGKQ
ncbi:hypothetical protein RC98_13465 [Pectobacterium carotovorum subsp. carotovorum]|nr:hypothetical protein RC98_13465 [Pectobacterium carotovorum subsp. carotovorum]